MTNVGRLAGKDNQYSLELNEYGLYEEQLGTCPKGKRHCLFIKYLPNPLASAWKFFPTYGEAIRAQDHWVDKLNRE